MLNRSLRLTVVKDEPNPDSSPMDIDHVADVVTRSAVVIITTYISMDILRKAAVYILSAKI